MLALSRNPLFDPNSSPNKPLVLCSLPSPVACSRPLPVHGQVPTCCEHGHAAKRCPSYQYSSVLTSLAPPRPAYMSPSAQITHFNHAASDWILDSGASHHITADLTNLSLHSPYDGSDGVIIGNGKGLKIVHIGSINFPGSGLIFSDTLHVPNIARNLISFSPYVVIIMLMLFSLTLAFRWWIVVQGKLAYAVLALLDYAFGRLEACLHQPLWLRRLPASLYRCGMLVLVTPLPRYLVLLSLVIIYLFLEYLIFLVIQASVLRVTNFLLYNSSLTSSMSLELVYSDVWTSPVLSIDGFKYYVLFVDDFTYHVWIYPLKRKSDVLPTIVAFKTLVENSLHTKIITLYTDNGGEFIALR